MPQGAGLKSKKRPEKPKADYKKLIQKSVKN